MSATTTQTARLIDCPACGERIELTTTYDVHLGGIEPSVTAKVSKATATLTMTGARVNHQCPPPKLLRDKGIASPALVIPSTREG